MDYNGAVMNPVVFFPSVIGSKRKASDRKMADFMMDGLKKGEECGSNRILADKI